MNDSIVGTFLEIEPLSRPDFLKVRETLTRIGYSQDGTLFQTCFVLHKRGRYYVVHYREMQALDGKPVVPGPLDVEHRNGVASLLAQWKGLGVRPIGTLEPFQKEGIKVIHFEEKAQWKLEPRYKIGKK